MRNYNKIILSFVLLFTFILNIKAQQKTENVSFKIRTTSPGGNFSPRNIGAIWVEDASGNFVKTLQVWADRRIQYLYAWNNKSNSNKVDALTSATLSSHQTHNVTWNVKNHLGNDVPDGQYVLKVEMTDQHAQGPLASFNFPIGEASNTSLFPDETYYHDIELSWVSVVTDVSDEKTIPINYQLDQNYPNPFNPTTKIKFSLPKDSFVTLKVYDALGKEVISLVNEQKSAGNYEVNFNAINLASGLYFYRIDADNFSESRKMMLLK